MNYASAKALSIQRKDGLSYLFSELTSAAECTLEAQGATEDDTESSIWKQNGNKSLKDVEIFCGNLHFTSHPNCDLWMYTASTVMH